MFQVGFRSFLFFFWHFPRSIVVPFACTTFLLLCSWLLVYLHAFDVGLELGTVVGHFFLGCRGFLVWLVSPLCFLLLLNVRGWRVPHVGVLLRRSELVLLSRSWVVSCNLYLSIGLLVFIVIHIYVVVIMMRKWFYITEAFKMRCLILYIWLYLDSFICGCNINRHMIINSLLFMRIRFLELWSLNFAPCILVW